MNTALTHRQVRKMNYAIYAAWIAGFEQISTTQQKEEFNTVEADEAWEGCKFEIDPEGTLLCHQPNHVTMVWNSSDQCWDDE
jgi:hypothetical protein